MFLHLVSKEKVNFKIIFYRSILNFNLPDNEREFEKHYTPVIY
jgi:hypothetical protein